MAKWRKMNYPDGTVLQEHETSRGGKCRITVGPRRAFQHGGRSKYAYSTICYARDGWKNAGKGGSPTLTAAKAAGMRAASRGRLRLRRQRRKAR